MKYNVKIIRSSRKSFSLSVSPENEITLRCPRNVSESRINAFLDSKKYWLDKVTVKNNAKLSVNKSVLEYTEIYVCGKKLPLIISDKNLITENAVYLKSIDKVKSVFIKNFSDGLISLARDLSDKCGLPASGFSIRSYRRRWGCCSSKGQITFNYLLFMLPLRLQRYVIIHELCHTVHFNHSADFWQLVSRFEPDYKILRNELKSFDYITNLY